MRRKVLLICGLILLGLTVAVGLVFRMPGRNASAGGKMAPTRQEAAFTPDESRVCQRIEPLDREATRCIIEKTTPLRLEREKLIAAGKFEKAKAIQQQVLDIAEKGAGPTSWLTVIARVGLDDLSSACRLDDAKRKEYIAQSRRLVQAEGRLSSGDFAGAERLAKRLIDDRARLLSEETLLTAYGLLGTARVARGDGVAAMEPLKRGLELQSRLHGVGDPRYLVNLGVLGEAFLAINKLDLAEQYLRESASGLRIIFGRNDLLYAGPLVPLGNLSLARGHAPEAESLFHEAMSIFEQLHTNEPIVPRCIDDLAQFYISQGEYVAANDSLRQALWKAETCLCDDHPKLAEILEHQAFVMRKLNRPAEAEAAETRAKSVRARFADRVARDAKSDSLEP